MRILVIISSLRCGGAERAAVTLSKLWADSGHTVRLTTIDSAKRDFYRLDPRVTRGELNLEQPSPTVLHALANNVRRILATRRDIRVFAPDIIIALMPTANVLAAVATLGLNARVIGCERVHPPQVPMDALREVARRWLYGLLDVAATLTSETAEWVRKHTHAKTIVVIPNVVTWPLEATDPYVSPTVACRDGRSILLAVGRFDPQKGFEGLIDAFAAIADRQPNWDLVILGDGPLRSTLQHRVDSLCLMDRVRMPGRVGNIADWYSRSELYVMSSLYEGFPNSLAEAMAHGLPAVSFDCDTGPRDIIRSGIDGTLVPAGNTKRLAAALDAMMSDRPLRHRYAARAIDVRERFSERLVVGKWNALFEDLLRGQSSRRR